MSNNSLQFFCISKCLLNKLFWRDFIFTYLWFVKYYIASINNPSTLKFNKTKILFMDKKKQKKVNTSPFSIYCLSSVALDTCNNLIASAVGNELNARSLQSAISFLIKLILYIYNHGHSQESHALQYPLICPWKMYRIQWEHLHEHFSLYGNFLPWWIAQVLWDAYGKISMILQQLSRTVVSFYLFFFFDLNFVFARAWYKHWGVVQEGEVPIQHEIRQCDFEQVNATSSAQW